MNRVFFALAVFTSATVMAQAPAPATAPAEPGFALTIYSTADPATFDPKDLAQQKLMNPYNAWQMKLPGYGVVREIRPIDLRAGENEIRFTDVASGIDPTTVSFQSLSALDATSVLEQNYEYDVVSANKLLEKYIGKAISVERKAGANGAAADNIQGILLSSDPNNIVLQNENGDASVISRGEVANIRLAKQQTGLITKPTLVWKVQATNPGRHNAQVTYQTDGLTWRADYNFIINKDDTAADVGAWVSLLNESGASYPNAKLKLVAGDVQRIQPQQDAYSGRMQVQQMAKSARADTGFQEKSFFEYHLYTLGRPTSLANNSTKQIELFPSRASLPVTKTFVYYGAPDQVRPYSPYPINDRDLGTQSNKKVDIYLQLKNTELNGMGIPLPAGRIRVYKKDEADGAQEFIGEDVIQHTPKDEDVLIKLGSAFDIVGERKQSNLTVDMDGHVITESFTITLRNHKKEAAHVIVKETLFRWTNWEITNSSDKYEKQDYRTIHIPVDVPADGKKDVKYTVKYTW